MNKKLMNIGFVVLCAVILIVLLKAPPETTKKTPRDKTHENPREYQNCPTCHQSGAEGPKMKADHIDSAGNLKSDHVKCYMCHKEQR